MELGKRGKEWLAVGKRLALQAFRAAAEQFPHLDDEEQLAEAARIWRERARTEIEARDHLLPILGQYLDLPAVDFTQRAAERTVIYAFLRQVQAAQQLERLKAEGRA